jgi:hypothetical protein
MKSSLSKNWLAAFLSASNKRFSAWDVRWRSRIYIEKTKKVYATSGFVARESVPQISSKWNYRLRDSALRNSTVTPSVAAEPTHALGFSNSGLNENSDVWHSFVGQKSDT